MDNSDFIRLSAEINALNVALQQTRVSHEHLADSIDSLRLVQDQNEARDTQSFWLLLGAMVLGPLVGTSIGNLIGGWFERPTPTDRVTGSDETRRRDPP
jgi:hypothetical protein